MADSEDYTIVPKTRNGYDPASSLVTSGTTEISNNEPGPSNSYLGIYYCRLMLGKYQRTRPFEPQNWSPEKTLLLPLPQELFDETRAEFSDMGLEAVGNIMNLDVATGLGAAALKSVGDVTAGLASATLAGVGGNVGSKIGEKLAGAAGITPERITSAVQQQIGMAPNPNPSVQFTGPSLRDFSFSWVFYPKSARESENIDYMIRVLKAAALPSHTFTNSTAILNYPDLCQINFFPWDSGGNNNGWGWSDKSIIRIKKCFIKSVRVSYSDQGTPAFFEGTQLPIMYRLSISLQETEYMLANDWGSDKTPISDSDVANFVIDKLQTATDVIAPGSGPLIDLFQTTLGAEGADPGV